MKRIIFTAVLIITCVLYTNAQGSRFVGSWLASDGEFSYKITFSMDTIVQDSVEGYFLFGDLTYYKSKKIIRHLKSDKTKLQLYVFLGSSNALPLEQQVGSDVFATYVDSERSSEYTINLTISNDNKSFVWEYNEMLSHEELITKVWKRREGIPENKPIDMPKKLVFNRL